MTEKQIKHIMETYHRKAMREPAKRLRAAIEQASKKRCWYNGWKHEGDRADYGILYDPMREFLPEAQFSDICAMCDFLLAKANKQIEKSDDDGDCAGQARYWMERMLKALMKCEGSLAEKIGWLEDFWSLARPMSFAIFAASSLVCLIAVRSACETMRIFISLATFLRPRVMV
jgi:hypothetical protein